MKILTIVGTRPQFIKAGSLSREVAKHSDIEEIILHTGQHYDANMSDIFFDQLSIPKPHYCLGIAQKSHGAMTGQMIEEIEKIVLKERPDFVVLFGDTNSTLAGAVAASKLQIKVAHIEAGLRSFNMAMPEEINRVLTDRVSKLLFCPTQSAVNNLINEGYGNLDCEIINSGDIMKEGASYYKAYANKPSFATNEPFLLCTIHRQENTNDLPRLQSIMAALEEIARDQQIILPLHPRTKKRLNQYDYKPSQNLCIVDPVGYREMIWLIDNSSLLLTDSGGLQKEAFFFGKPCITLREETEWVELIENRFSILTGANRDKIITAYRNRSLYFESNFQKDLFGTGNTSQNIINIISDYR